MTTNSGFPMAAELAQKFVPGQKLLNRYTLERVLGQGGMGIVWLARDEELDLMVALKFLPALVVNDRASLNDLKRETRRSLELTHPNIVRTYDFLQDSSLAGISMEYVDSDTLRNRRIDQPSGVFQTTDLGTWTPQLCDALDYAHKTASIVHRDLKPANLLVNARNHLKVADFGISRSLVESVTQVTGGNSVSGTLVYMSPQQLEGNPAHPLDDIYAVGATLYELCTSRPPFFSGDISRQVHLKVPPSMADRRTELSIPQGELPQNWETTVAACLAKDPLHRPQSAGEIAVRLGLREAASVSTTTTASFPSPTIPAPRPTGALNAPFPAPPTALGGPAAVPYPVKHRNHIPLVAAVAAVVLVAAGAIWFLGGRTGKSPTNQAGSATPGEAAGGHTVAKIREVDAASQTQETSRTVQAAETERLAKARGGIFVESDPSGAIVKVDDRPAERTPVALKDLPLGSHSVKVTMDGYEDSVTQVDVKENQVTPVGKISLARSAGWLTVTTIPAGAEITVSGPDGPLKSHLTGPWKSDKLPVGDYEITSTRPGWSPVVRKVSLARDQAIPVTFDLSGGSVQIDSVPAKATVLVDGKPVGITPCTLQDIQPGNIEYALALTGYTNATLHGTVETGQLLKLDAKLVKPVGPKPVVASHQTSTRTARHHGDDDDNDDHHSSGGFWGNFSRGFLSNGHPPVPPHP